MALQNTVRPKSCRLILWENKIISTYQNNPCGRRYSKNIRIMLILSKI